MRWLVWPWSRAPPTTRTVVLVVVAALNLFGEVGPFSRVIAAVGGHLSNGAKVANNASTNHH